MKKTLLALLLTLCIFMSTGISSFAISGNLIDVTASDWFYDNVTYMVNMGSITGYEDGTFRPNGTITNGEFLSVLMKTLTGQSSFPVTGKHWASGVLQCAYDFSVCAESDLTESALNTPITRAMAAKYTSNAVTHLLDEDTVDAQGIPELINDIGDVYDSGCESAIFDMYARGIITGDTSGNFNPYANIKRSEAATIVLRAYDPSIRQLPFGLSASLESIWPDWSVFFLNCYGSRYDVQSISVDSITANGVNVDIQTLVPSQDFNDYISDNPDAYDWYSSYSTPDAVVGFSWDSEAAIANATEYYIDEYDSSIGYPIITFVFNLNLIISDGSHIPYSFTARYYIEGYGGIL